jgi:HK97 family phage portal protein
MIREAVSKFFGAQRFVGLPAPVQFFDNGLGPIRWLPADDTAAGVPQRGLEVAAFHACVRVIAESVSSLPFHLLLNAGDVRQRDTTHPYDHLVHRRPNPWQTGYEFLEQLVGHTATWGNAYAYKKYGRSGLVEELWPLHPSTITPVQVGSNVWAYDYLPWEAGDAGRLASDQILHIRYLSDNGFVGLVPLALSANTIAMARSMDLAAKRFWDNDARPGVILETSQPVPQEALEKLRQQWEKLHRGTDNTGRTAVLPNGVSAKQLPATTAESSQLIQLRTFVVQEIARAMRVPCSLIGENSRSTFSNSEQEALNWAQCIVPWCRRVESAFQRALLDDMPDHTFQLDMRGMLRGDSAARAAYYTQLHSLSALSPNDIRRFEDMPPIANPAADEYYTPINNIGTLTAAAEAGNKADPSQMGSILAVLQAVSGGTLQPAGAEALILATYPAMDHAAVAAMVEAAEPPEEEAAETPAEEAAEEEVLADAEPEDAPPASTVQEFQE